MEANKREIVFDYINEADQRLEETGQSSANRAFNLGCWMGLLPTALLSILIFFLSKGSWVVTFVSAVMIFISLAALSNLIAYIAKNRSINRYFDEQMENEIEQQLVEFDISHQEFNQVVETSLPAGSALRKTINRTNTVSKSP